MHTVHPWITSSESKLSKRLRISQIDAEVDIFLVQQLHIADLRFAVRAQCPWSQALRLPVWASYVSTDRMKMTPPPPSNPNNRREASFNPNCCTLCRCHFDTQASPGTNRPYILMPADISTQLKQHPQILNP